MSLHDVGQIPSLLSFNVGAAAGLAFIDPLLVQFNLALTGAFGLGTLQVDLSAEFNAAVSATAELGLSISNPFLAFSAALEAVGQLAASLSAALAAGLPTVSLEVSAQISAAAALIGTLSVKLGGISLLLEAALRVKLPAVKFFAELAASLSAGPAHILSWDQSAGPYTMADVGTDLDSLFHTGLTGILPTDNVYGVLIITKAPSCWVGIQATLLVE
jgi:hypothetical protein